MNTFEMLPASTAPVTLALGLVHYPGYFDPAAQAALLDELRVAFESAPPFTPRMPRTGRPFSVRMSNCGPLGWVSDEAGYRYQPTHPETGAPWPPMPDIALRAWRDLGGYAQPPEACLINIYEAKARMGLHQDRDEADFNAPVISLSLGDTAVFRFGGLNRRDPTRAIRLASGDALVLGGPSRLAFHGVDRVMPGTSPLPGLRDRRINLTLRRVTAPDPSLAFF